MYFVLLMIDTLIGNGLQSVFGDSMWLGIFTLVWFGAFTLLQGLKLDAKLAILVPAAILAMIYLPMLTMVVALIIGGVLYLAVMKFINR